MHSITGLKQSALWNMHKVKSTFMSMYPIPAKSFLIVHTLWLRRVFAHFLPSAYNGMEERGHAAPKLCAAAYNRLTTAQEGDCVDELTVQNAQKIADGIMHIIPHNINIMNRFGYVIASGDASRLNTLNMGAVHALSTLNPYIIYADTKTERRGVYLPIQHAQRVVGVIGINGDIDDIMPMAQMTLFTAQLMLENQEYHTLSLRKTALRQEFLLEWANAAQAPYPQSLIEQGKGFGVDIASPYTALLLEEEEPAENAWDGMGPLIEPQLERGEIVVWNRKGECLVAIPSQRGLAQRANAFCAAKKPGFAHAYAGEATATLALSIRQARQAKMLAHALSIRRPMVTHREVCLEEMLLSASPSSAVLALQRVLAENDNGGDLLDTVCVYMDRRDDISAVCAELHIHRNTLNYRLNRLEELTSKNPRRGKDLLELYLTALRIKTGEGGTGREGG